jgi:phenylpyruvate tautomerase PptA (4-oxalocrotonate tautomerase family)
MPVVEIHIRIGRSAEEKKAQLNAVHGSLVEALKIPENDRIQRIREYAAEDFEIPQGKTENFTLIKITMFPGRSVDAKRNLYQVLIKHLRQLGIDPMDVFIILHVPPMENWGIRGGIPANEVDLGFKVDV